MFMDLDLLEAKYQAAMYRGTDVGKLVEDFRLRYGDRADHMYGSVSYILALDQEAKRREAAEAMSRGPELAGHVRRRASNRMGIVALYGKYVSQFVDEGEVKAAFTLLDAPDGLRQLLSMGVLMHMDESTVFVPEYLFGLIVEAQGLEVPVPRVNPREVLSSLAASDVGQLAVLEADVFGEEVDPDLFQYLYGEEYSAVRRSFRVWGFASYFEELGRILVTPAISLEEVVDSMMEVKDYRARRMNRLLGLHGEYEFDRRTRCGKLYISVDSTRSGIGIALICPWLVPSRRLVGAYGRYPRVFVLWGYAAPHVKDAYERYFDGNTGLIFLSEGSNVQVIMPSTRFHSHIVDLLYRYGLNVNEL